MQVTKGTWRMREQCVPGSLSSSPAQEPGNEARWGLGTRLSTQHLHATRGYTTDIYLHISGYSSARGILCACVFLVIIARRLSARQLIVQRSQFTFVCISITL